jgi:thymidine phosphorylase
MSKKLAEGIDGLVLDVKVGSGAFMKSLKDARALATGLIKIGKAFKKKTMALITNMDQPLGLAVGNSLEVEECLEVLNGKGPNDLRELSLELSAHMIVLGKKAKTLGEARKLATSALQSGEAYKKFQEVIAAQGGRLPLPKATKTDDYIAKKSGFVFSMDTEKVGLASLLLGAGRLKVDDMIDPTAGILFHDKIGAPVKKGQRLATLYFNGDKPIKEVKELLDGAFVIRKEKPKKVRLIFEKVD